MYVTKKNNFYITLHEVTQTEWTAINYRLSYCERYIDDGHYNYVTKCFPMPVGYDEETTKLEDIKFPCELDIPIALTPWLTKFFPLPVKFVKPSDVFKITEEDAEFLSTKFEVNVLDLYDQIVTGFPRALVQLPTGTGKTFILSALVRAYQGEGNILIMSPSSMVRKEISLRTGASIGVNGKDKVAIVDYSGFGNSSKIWFEGIQDWLAKVDVVLYDESESLPSGAEEALWTCTSARFFWGFSANPDAINDNCLYNIQRLDKVLDSVFHIMKYFGVASVYMNNRKTINLHLVNVQLANRAPMTSNAYSIIIGYRQLQKESWYIPFFKFVIDQSEGIVFSLIPYKGSIEFVSMKLKELKIPHVRWSANSVIYVDIEGNEEKIDYTKLKELCSLGKFSVSIILATTVAKQGVNILQLTDVILTQGNKYGNLNQPIGRVRNRTPNVWTYSPSWMQGNFNSITGRSRIKTLKEHYDCNITMHTLN